VERFSLVPPRMPCPSHRGRSGPTLNAQPDALDPTLNATCHQGEDTAHRAPSRLRARAPWDKAVCARGHPHSVCCGPHPHSFVMWTWPCYLSFVPHARTHSRRRFEFVATLERSARCVHTHSSPYFTRAYGHTPYSHTRLGHASSWH
jgi:hypothetical protein